MASTEPMSQSYPLLTLKEANGCKSDVAWRSMMLEEARRQSLALERLAGILGTHGEELQQIRVHFASWAVEES